MTLRDGILATKNKDLLVLEMEGDSKVVIDCYNKKINIPSSIVLLMEDIWKVSQDLNIYICRQANRIADCLAKRGLSIVDSNVW